MTKKRLVPFLFGMVPVIMIGYFGLVFVTPAAAQVSGASVSDECHITDVSKAIRLSIYIPGVTEMLVGDDKGTKYPYVQNMSCFIADMYRYLAGAAGILAVTMMIYGGIKYTVSFGNPSTLSDARDTISSAMIGLALVLGSYVILNFINPHITSLQVPYLTDIAKNEIADATDFHGLKVCIKKAETGSSFACGADWHVGKEDQCRIVGKCKIESQLCSLFVGSDTKPSIFCADYVPVLYQDKNYQAHARNDVSCGVIIFDGSNVLVGTKCLSPERACGINVADDIPHLYATGEARPPGQEDPKYIGNWPKAFCY